ncbi:hypothetical protein CDCA_CDCA08G2310 [Cyanidium caldarium]|uniref:CBS domain-containing protein n=1 Tax=Cyanidium caldarium TaxID=2771 RepID=A0AAV9IVE8_CYACA|nr:hypothetical protein CDCA_CDCA08G2310 [Cyanidium caldarium]
MRAAWVSACGTVPARRLVSFLSSWRATNGLSSSTRMQAVREKSKRFWDARAGAALPAYYEGFVSRTGVMEAAQPVGDAHQVQVRLAPSGGGESMVFLHESSSVMGALLEMRQRNTSYVLVAGDPIEAYRRARATTAAGEGIAWSEAGAGDAETIVRVSAVEDAAAAAATTTATASRSAPDADTLAVVGLFTERDFLRTLVRSWQQPRSAAGGSGWGASGGPSGAARLWNVRLGHAMSHLQSRFGILKETSHSVMDAVAAMMRRGVQTIPLIREEENAEDYMIPATVSASASAAAVGGGGGGGSVSSGKQALHTEAAAEAEASVLTLPPRVVSGVLTARDIARFFLAQDTDVQEAVCSDGLAHGATAAFRHDHLRPLLLRDVMSMRLRRTHDSAHTTLAAAALGPDDDDDSSNSSSVEHEYGAVVSISRSASVRDAIAVMARHDLSTLLVTDAGDAGEDAGGPYPGVLGVISLHDAIRQVFTVGRDPAALSVETLLRERWQALHCDGLRQGREERKYGISPDDEVVHVLRLLGGMGERHIPVYVYNDADQTSNCIAMVSVKDVLGALNRVERRRRGLQA